jgi:hypothetical protein
LNALNDILPDIEWIEKYANLYVYVFSGCALQPEGRPALFLTNHKGIEYNNIGEFQLLFCKRKHPDKFYDSEDEILKLMNDFTNYTTKQDFEDINLKCKKAILDQLLSTKWLVKYADLYDTCTIKPKDSIPFAMSFFEDEYYKPIEDFVNLYANRKQADEEKFA